MSNIRNWETISSHVAEFEEFYNGVNGFPVINNNLLLVSQLPVPESFAFENLGYNDAFYSLENLLKQDIEPCELFWEARVELFPIFNDGTHKKTFRLIETLNNTIFTYYKEADGVFEPVEPKKRDYEENILKFTHPLKVELLLPKNAPAWVHALALSHDSIEDSHRHVFLKDWYKGRLTDAKKQTLEELFGITIPQEFNIEIYNRAWDKIHNQYMGFLSDNTSFSGGDLSRIEQGLRLLSKPINVSYKDYLTNIVNYSDKDLEVAYWAMMIKLNDRIDNSHFNPTMDGEFSSDTQKVLRDGVKNMYLFEAVKEMYLKFGNELTPVQEKELLMRMDSLSALTNRNMNNLMRNLSKKYSKFEISTGEYGGNNLGKVYLTVQSALIDYYKAKGFEEMDDITADYEDDSKILEFSGWLNLFDNWLEKRDAVKPFGNKSLNYKQKINIFKAASIIKTFASLHLSCEPSANSTLDYLEDSNYGLDTLGSYKANLNLYFTKGFMIM